MKKKSKSLIKFMDGLHNAIVMDKKFRKNVINKSENQIQTEIRPLIIRYLEEYFKGKYKDYIDKANKSFYWEGQEGKYGRSRKKTFGSRNYPDFIILKPYLIAIEYKKSQSGSLVKQGIGQSIIHTMSGDFDYVYFLFQDENRKKEKEILNSLNNSKEKDIVEKLWNEFNVMLRIV